MCRSDVRSGLRTRDSCSYLWGTLARRYVVKITEASGQVRLIVCVISTKNSQLCLSLANTPQHRPSVLIIQLQTLASLNVDRHTRPDVSSSRN